MTERGLKNINVFIQRLQTFFIFVTFFTFFNVFFIFFLERFFTSMNTYWDAGKGNLTAQNTRKPFGGRGSAPSPRWGSLQRCSRPPSWWGRAGCPLPKNPIPSPSGLASPPNPTPKLVPTPLCLSVRHFRVLYPQTAEDIVKLLSRPGNPSHSSFLCPERQCPILREPLTRDVKYTGVGNLRFFWQKSPFTAEAVRERPKLLLWNVIKKSQRWLIDPCWFGWPWSWMTFDPWPLKSGTRLFVFSGRFL